MASATAKTFGVIRNQAATAFQSTLRPVGTPVARLPNGKTVELKNGIRYANPPHVAGQPPLKGATSVYNRVNDPNSRMSPVDLEFFAFDKNGKAVQQSPAQHAAIEKVHQAVYNWKPEAMAAEMRKAGASEPAIQKALKEKSGLFWESLAQNFAKDLLSNPQTAGTGPNAISSLVVKTRVEGGRDPLIPVTREITIAFDKNALNRPEIELKVVVPKHMLPQFKEGTSPRSVELVTRAKPQERSKNTDYPDFSAAFAPMQHLVLQGGRPEQVPASGMKYENAQAFVSKATQVLTDLSSKTTASRVAEQVKPFLNDAHYPVFKKDLPGYRAHLLRAQGEVPTTLGDFVLRVDGKDHPVSAPATLRAVNTQGWTAR